MRNNPRLCKYPHKHSDLGLKRENSWKQRTCNSVLDPDFGLKGEAVQYSSCLPLIKQQWEKISHCSWLYHFCNFNKNKLKNNDIFIYIL